MRVYKQSNAPGGPVRADSAVQAARILARRVFGCQGRVESFHATDIRWHEIGPGFGRIGGRGWRALLVLAPTAEQRVTGLGYTRRSLEVFIAHGETDTGEAGATAAVRYRTEVAATAAAAPERAAAATAAAAEWAASAPIRAAERAAAAAARAAAEAWRVNMWAAAVERQRAADRRRTRKAGWRRNVRRKDRVVMRKERLA